MKEATARIKINKLLEAAGWRFFADSTGPANIQLEPSVTLQAHDLDALGEDFEKASKGFIDFLLLNEKGFPFIVLEAKAENKNPLVGKEQARRYARSQNCRFVILSNGNLHYFWDLERGNPSLITTFPRPDSVAGYQKSAPDPGRLVEEPVADADTAAAGSAICAFAQPRWIPAGIWWLLLCFSGAPSVRGTSTQAFSGGNTLLLGSAAADGGAGGGTGSENGFFAALTHQAGVPIMPNPPSGLSYLGNAATPLPTLRAA